MQRTAASQDRNKSFGGAALQADAILSSTHVLSALRPILSSYQVVMWLW